MSFLVLLRVVHLRLERFEGTFVKKHDTHIQPKFYKVELLGKLVV